MYKIARALDLRPIDTVRLLEIDAKIKKREFMNIEDFRELLMFLPGLTSQLRSVTNIQPHDMLRMKVDVETYAEMKSEYKERLNIPII